MAKRKVTSPAKFATRGVSFPIAPFNIMEWALHKSAREGKNFSGYIIQLILDDKAREERK